MSPARTPRPHRRPGPPADPLRDPPSGPAPAAAVAPAGSLDSFCPLIDLASIISDSRRDKPARHAEKPYPARKAQDLPGCYVRSSGVGSSVEASHLQGTGTRDHVCVWRAPAGIFNGRVLRDIPSRGQCLTCCVPADVADRHRWIAQRRVSPRLGPLALLASQRLVQSETYEKATIL